LIDSEWGQSENNRRAKYYKLTAEGRKQLSRESSEWRRLAEALARVMETA
jgi:DNA-binding PadR family transcriptional regulator